MFEEKKLPKIQIKLRHTGRPWLWMLDQPYRRFELIYLCALATRTVYMHCNTQVRTQNQWLCQYRVSKCRIKEERYGRRERETHIIRSGRSESYLQAHPTAGIILTVHHFNSDWSPSPKAGGGIFTLRAKNIINIIIVWILFLP